MYKFSECIAKQKSINGFACWVYLNIDKITAKDIFTDYQEAYCKVTDSYLDGVFYLRLSTIKYLVGTIDLPLNTWAAQNPNAIIDTIQEGTLKVYNRTLRWHDGTNFDFIPKNISPDTADGVSADPDKETWLLLSQEGADYTGVENRYLFDVQGLIHRSKVFPDGINIIDGAPKKNCNYNFSYGIWDFASCGKISQIELTADNILHLDDATSMWTRTVIDVGRDLSGKTPILIICGKPFFVNKTTVNTYGNTMLVISPYRLKLYETYIETYYRLGLEKLGFEDDPNKFGLVRNEVFQSDYAIKKLLTIPQSFIVLIDTDELYMYPEYVDGSAMPDHYIAHTKPIYPLISERHEPQDYLYNHDDGLWAVNTNISPYRKYVMHTPEGENPLYYYTPSAYSTHLRVHRHPYFLVMGKDPKIVKT